MDVQRDECHVNMQEQEPDDIPTFDASDVEHRLTKERSALERSIGKVAIAIFAYNPLPLLHIALVQAHTHGRRTRSSAFDVAYAKNGLDDLDLQKPSHLHSSIPVASVDDLPPAIQCAFRQSVLRALIIYAASVTALVVVCLLGLPIEATKEAIYQSSLMVWVATVSVYAVITLSMVLLFVLRFESPVNYGVLGLVTLTEVICTVLFGNPHRTVPGLALFTSGLVLLSSIVCRIPRCKTTDQPLELTHPTKAALITIVVLAAVALPINAAMGSDLTRLSTIDALEVLAGASGALLWLSQVLSVLTHTMEPEQHSTALIFFQADLVVVFIVMPSEAVIKRVRRIVRFLRTPRDGNTGQTSIRENAVLPFTLQEGVPAITSRASRPLTPLYPAHLVPYHSHTHGGEASIEESPGCAGTIVDSTLSHGGPRHRNSISQ